MNGEAKKRYKEIDLPFTCPLTNRIFNSTKGLAIYIAKSLKMDHQEYYDIHINHRESNCFFCNKKGLFISVGRGYRNLCEDPECVKKSFSSHSVEGFMYRNNCSKEQAQILFEEENSRQLSERMKTQQKLREIDPLWDKKRAPSSIEFWISRGFSQEESKIEANKCVKNFIYKSSQTIKNDKEKYASKFPTKVEYYLKRGFTELEAKQEISKIQNRFSLKKCVQKHGEEKGKLIWEERQNKWQKSLFEGGRLKAGYSEISQILFRDISQFYEIDDLSDVFFYTKNSEYYLGYGLNKYFVYDFTDIGRKKIIEYNGDQYHANPKTYQAEDYAHKFHESRNLKAKDIWEKDKRKSDLATLNGFDVLSIWDSEYKSDKKATLDKCLLFLELTAKH